MSEVLDLSGANVKGFDLIPSGRQPGIVFECEATETQNDGKMPAGTKGYKVQFKVDGGEYDNRRLFNNYWLPTADEQQDASKREFQQGMFVKFLLAIGYAEKDVLGGKFKFDPEDAVGRECLLVVGKKAATDQYEESNVVKNVLPRSAGTSDDSDLL